MCLKTRAQIFGIDGQSACYHKFRTLYVKTLGRRGKVVGTVVYDLRLRLRIIWPGHVHSILPRDETRRHEIYMSTHPQQTRNTCIHPISASQARSSFPTTPPIQSTPLTTSAETGRAITSTLTKMCMYVVRIRNPRGSGTELRPHSPQHPPSGLGRLMRLRNGRPWTLETSVLYTHTNQHIAYRTGTERE